MRCIWHLQVVRRAHVIHRCKQQGGLTVARDTAHDMGSRRRSRSPLSLLILLPFILLLLSLLPSPAVSDVPHDTTSPVPPPEGCTAIAVTLSASLTGPMTTHTNDCKDCDFRLSLVPSLPPSTPHPVPPSRFAYPRYVGPDHGHTLLPSSLDPYSPSYPPTTPLTYISPPSTSSSSPSSSPSSHTPSPTLPYLDGSYAIQNSHGVSIGESTCAARLVAAPLHSNGSALFDVSELTRIALATSRTALEAIHTMGGLAEAHGYYGAEWLGDYARGEAGEGLTITDATSAWVFHITPDDTGRSAVWAAQRVPDGHVAVISNAFIIQHLNLSDTHTFRASSNVHAVARRLGWWRGEEKDGPLNFAAVYGSKVSFEVYCSRRTWRVFTMVGERGVVGGLRPDMGVLELPFSVPVERPLGVWDLFRVQRDHYENTSFDLTQGPAAGPYGNPNRYDRGEASGVPMYALMQGTFERPISMFRTSYSFVTESGGGRRRGGGEGEGEGGGGGDGGWREHRVWFAPGAPHASVYVPLWVGSGEVPSSLGVDAGSLYRFRQGSAWWAVTAVSNWMERMWSHISRDVRRHQHTLEHRHHTDTTHLLTSLDSSSSSHDDATALHAIRRYQAEAAANATRHWTALFYHLVTKYHDGYEVDVEQEVMDPTALFYPLDWLRDVGFWGRRGVGPDWEHKGWSYTEDYTPGLKGEGGEEAKGGVGWGDVPAGGGKGGEGGGRVEWTKVVLVSGLTLVLGLLAGIGIGRWFMLSDRRREYEAL